MARRRPSGESRAASLTPKGDEDLIRLARKRFKQAESAEEQQRERELEDLQFYASMQWPQTVINAREGLPGNPTNGQPPVPARPTLTINKVREPVRQVLNQERQSELGVEIAAADDFGDGTPGISENEIELREGLVRKIQRESQAADARSWAFTRSAIAGRGFYRVMTRYASGKTFDQELCVDRIYNQASVLLDPSHESPDGSDADWGFIGADVPWDRYKAEYGDRDGRKNRLLSVSDGEWRALGDELPGWFSLDNEQRAVRVVEYWYTERVPKEIVQLVTGETIDRADLEDGDEIARDDAGHEITRTDIEKQIKWVKIDGVQILDETDWEGHYIPIIKVLGEELQPFDSERRSEGMVRPARDSNRAANVMISKLVERIEYGPMSQWLGPAGFDQGFEDEWAVANTRALTALHYNPKGLDGQPIEKPERVQGSADVSDLAQAIQLFDQGVKTTTAVPDSTLGNVDPRVRSKVAIQALVQNAQQGTSHYLDNLARSIRYEGLILNDLLYPIYGKRPGRMARLMTPTGDTKAVPVGVAFVPHPETQQPQTTIQGPMGPAQVTSDHPNAQIYTLTPDATFNLAVKVTKNYDTRREQQENTLAEIVQNDPQSMRLYGDLVWKYNDGPGHQELEERAEFGLDPSVRMAIQAKKSGQDPQVAALAAQVQQLQQQLAAKTPELQAKLQIAQLQEQGESQRADAANQTAITKQEIATTGTVSVAQAKIDAENARTYIDALENRLGKVLELHMKKLDQVHEAIQNARTQAHDVGLAAMDHAATLHQTAQAAALAPPPTQNGDGTTGAS